MSTKVQVGPYPLDVLGAQTEAMIGYLIEQELGNVLPVETAIATPRAPTSSRPGRRSWSRSS
jgi:carbamate kinase